MQVVASRDDIEQLPKALHEALLDRFRAEDLAEHARFFGILAAVVSTVGVYAYRQTTDPSAAWFWAVVLGGVGTTLLILFALWQQWRVRKLRSVLADGGYDDSLMTEEDYCNVYLLPKVRAAIHDQALPGIAVAPKYLGSPFRRRRDRLLKFLLFVVLPVVIGSYVAGVKGAVIGALVGGLWTGWTGASSTRGRDTDR